MWRCNRTEADERPPLPRVVAAPPAGRVLVLAPHPDDETFGMGGTIRLHVEQGDRVDVVFLTDGGFGDPDDKFAGEDYAALRRQEAAAAAEVLGITETVFYGYPDHYPQVSDEALRDLAGRLAADVTARAAANLYLPWPGECHQDHWLAARAALIALESVPRDIRAIGYEVWSAMVPDTIVDVTPVRDVKLEAGRCYASQLAYTPYLSVTDGLMTYRSLHLKRSADDPPRYGEAFLRIDRR